MTSRGAGLAFHIRCQPWCRLRSARTSTQPPCRCCIAQRAKFDYLSNVAWISGFRQMTDTATPSRPLSPHLQVYRWPITMVMSIAHRITGGALYFGTILLVLLLLSAASGERAYDRASAIFGSIPGRIVLFGYTWALLHHMLGGIRHFIWDTGRGMEPGEREGLAWANIAGSIVLTLILWAFALFWR